jgi:hypothetical protein
MYVACLIGLEGLLQYYIKYTTYKPYKHLRSGDLHLPLLPSIFNRPWPHRMAYGNSDTF